MKLSGWARLGIVASVIWWAAGAFILIPQFPASNTVADYMLAACQPQTTEQATQCQMIEGMLAEARQRAWFDLAPWLVLWLFGPAIAWGGWLWIWKGFMEGPPKGAPPSGRSKPFDF